VPPWPTQRYSVEVCVDAGVYWCAASAEIGLGPFQIADGGLRLDAASLAPSGFDPVRAPDGTWWPESRTASAPAGLRFDEAGRAHRLRMDPDDHYAVWHERQDTAGWSGERIATPERFGAARFDVTPGGAPHVLYARGMYPWLSLVHVERSSTGWAETVVPLPAGFVVEYDGPKLAAARDGTIALAVKDGFSNDVGVCWRAPEGPWTCESTGSEAWDVGGVVALASPRHVGIAYEPRYPFAMGPTDTVWLERSDSGWAEPVVLEGFVAAAPPAISPAGDRIALIGNGPGSSGAPDFGKRLRLAIRTTGEWRTAALSPVGSGGGGAWVGFLADGRVWARSAQERFGASPERVAATWTEAP
jgi:hypothetical protein